MHFILFSPHRRSSGRRPYKWHLELINRCMMGKEDLYHAYALMRFMVEKVTGIRRCMASVWSCEQDQLGSCGDQHRQVPPEAQCGL